MATFLDMAGLAMFTSHVPSLSKLWEHMRWDQPKCKLRKDIPRAGMQSRRGDRRDAACREQCAADAGTRSWDYRAEILLDITLGGEGLWSPWAQFTGSQKNKDGVRTQGGDCGEMEEGMGGKWRWKYIKFLKREARRGKWGGGQ